MTLKEKTFFSSKVIAATLALIGGGYAGGRALAPIDNACVNCDQVIAATKEYTDVKVEASRIECEKKIEAALFRIEKKLDYLSTTATNNQIDIATLKARARK